MKKSAIKHIHQDIKKIELLKYHYNLGGNFQFQYNEQDISKILLKLYHRFFLIEYTENYPYESPNIYSIQDGKISINPYSENIKRQWSSAYDIICLAKMIENLFHEEEKENALEKMIGNMGI